MGKLERAMIVVALIVLAAFGYITYSIMTAPSSCLPNGTGCGAPPVATN